MTTALFRTPTERNTGTRYDPEIKQLAFEIYAFKANRKVMETSRILGALGYEIVPATLYEWRRDQGWEDKIALEEAVRQEGLVRAFAGKLREVGPDSVTYLDDVANGRVEGDQLRVKAATVLVTENRRLVEALEREQRRAGQALPVYPDFAGLSEAELLALETPWIPE